MQRKKTLAYETKVAKGTADRPDSVAPASGIRLVRPPIATLPGASTVPPPASGQGVARAASVAEPRAGRSAPPLALVPAPSAPRPGPPSVRAPLAPSRTLVPPPPASGQRARVPSSAPPPPRKPTARPEPQLLDDDALVDDDAETVADTSDLVEVEATPIPPPPRRGAGASSAPPRPASSSQLPSLKATGQNWPRVEWPRLDVVPTPPATLDDVYVDPAPIAMEPAAVATETQLIPPPLEAPPFTPPFTSPGSAERDVELVDTSATTSIVHDEDVVDFRPESPVVRLRRALALLPSWVAWLDANPRAFASVGFGAGVVVALFVALLVG